MSPDRRTFLKTTGAAVSGAAVGACTPQSPSADAEASGDRILDEALLRAVAEVVLPAELGTTGHEQVVLAFQGWARSYQPVAELNHGYGTSEIRYGPPDVVPAWQAQLRALDLEATKRHAAGFASLEASLRDQILRRQVDDSPEMPGPLRAHHVAVALLSFWLSSPEATDRCYGVRVGPRTCRSIESAPDEPDGVT